MENSDFENMSDSEIKSHSEILQLIDEIRIYEQNFVDFSTDLIEETKEEEHELIEIKHKKPSLEKHSFEKKMKAKRVKKKHKSLKKKQKKAKPKVSTTFKIGFDDGGELVNLDLKKPKTKQKGDKSKNKFNLKSILPFKKKGKDNAEGSSDSPKSSKLKGGLGKLGKLKKVIPNKNKSSNEETKK